MISEQSFGDWLRRQRKALDLTQAELARQVGCSTITLRKLEAEERRPSKQVAERLAEVLQVPPDERPAFLHFARGNPFAAPAAVKSASTRHHNLPQQLTRFIGREDELAEVRRLLTASRLVTLTGAGGSGKTRLALQVAAGLLDTYPDGLWLVELAPLADPALVPAAVAKALGLQSPPGRPILDTLREHLRGQTALLVLDNCEHLIGACAQLAEALLQACPGLSCLTTSREALGVLGETAYLVPMLFAPDPREAATLDELLRYPAVQLFADRAQAIQAGFHLTPANAPAVAHICHQLDGMPLALELAAARVKLLSVQQIAERLDERFHLLTGGSRTALPRQQTLTALIDWSYDLLSGAEQQLLGQVSVFAGGWTLEAAQAVARDTSAAAVLDGLDGLVNKSLVLVEQSGGTARYRLLETIRQYARGKLETVGEADAVQQRHAAYYLQQAEAIAGREPLPPAGQDRLALERDNLRAALTWSLSAPGAVEGVLRLAPLTDSYDAVFESFVERMGYLEAVLAAAQPQAHAYPLELAHITYSLAYGRGIEGKFAVSRRFLSESLRQFRLAGDRKSAAMALNRLGWTAREQGDTVAAHGWLEESLALCRELGDERGVASALLTLAEVAVIEEDPDRATGLIRRSLEILEPLGDRLGIGYAQNHLGHVAQLQGDYDRAARLHEQSLQAMRQTDLNFGVAEANHCLGETALARADPDAAAAYFEESLTVCRRNGIWVCQTWCLAGLAGVAVLDEEPQRAAWLWGAAEAWRAALGVRPGPATRAMHEQLQAQAREQLGEAAFAAAWAEGQQAAPEQAVAAALTMAVFERQDIVS